MTIGASLILDIHVMINLQLSQQVIRLPLSFYHIAGSGLEVTEVSVVGWALTRL